MMKEEKIKNKASKMLTELRSAQLHALSALNHYRDLRKLLKDLKKEAIKCL